MKVTSIVGIGVVLVVAALAGQVDGSWKFVPLEQRIKSADLVVVGRITDVRDGMSVTYSEEWHSLHSGLEIFYSVGTIEVSEFLQGDRWLEEVEFVYPRPEARNVEYELGDHRATAWVVNYESYEVTKGVEGIWILKFGEIIPTYALMAPHDYLPMDSLEAVKKFAVLKKGRR